MIITLKGANFKDSNIGTLTTWPIMINLGNGATSSNSITFVDKEPVTSYTTTITIADEYRLDGNVIVTMHGQKLENAATINGKEITIFIGGVTGPVIINVPTKSADAGGEEPDIPVTPTNYTFTINPDPDTATVTLSATGYSTVSGTGSKSITVANGTEVNWRVEASGYTPREGSWAINGGNKTENITLTATSGGGGSTLDLSTLTLAHCGSAKLGDGDKENLIYNQSTHELKVHSTGWYKVSYFEQPVTVGTEIEYVTNYGKTQTGNFVGIYEQADLVDGVAEAKSSFWPAPSKFGVYAPGQGSGDYIYIWDKQNAKTKTAEGLEGDYFNGKTIKLKLLATGTEIYVDGVKLTWASGAAPATLTEGTNYYLGFHNSAASSAPADTGLAQTITYIGPIR